MRIPRVLAVVFLIYFLGASIGISQEAVNEKRGNNTQKRIAWLEENSVEITSSNINKKKYKDLMPLEEKIGDARIVMLGDQSHGNGTTFQMNCRLVRFLHEEMGFNVLAWESGLLCCREVDRAFLEDDEPISDLVDKGIFAIFGWSEQIRPLFEYIKNNRGSDNPLILAGFDVQFTSRSCKEDFPKTLDRFFNDAKPGLLPTDKINELEQLMVPLINYTEDEIVLNRLLDMAEYLLDLFKSSKKKLKKVYSKRELGFYRQVLRNFKAYINQKIVYPIDIWLAGEIRDTAGGETLMFLADEYYSGEKIIVWAASYHTMRNPHLVEPTDDESRYEKAVTMGHVVHQKLGDEVYSIAPITYTGYRGYSTSRGETTEIPPAEKDTLIPI